MTKRITIVLVSALILVVALGGSASADTNLGLKVYTWPAHCGSQVILYSSTHHILVGGDELRGNIGLNTCTADQDRIWYMDFSWMKVWARKPSGALVQVGHTMPAQFVGSFGGGCQYPVSCESVYHSDWFSCNVGWTYWFEVYYQVDWYAGAHTGGRDNNSYAWTSTEANCS